MKAIIISGFLFDLSDNINPFLDKDTDLYIHTWNSSENLRWINKARRLKKYVNNFEIHIEDKKFDNKLPYIGHRYIDLKGKKTKILFKYNEEVKAPAYNKLFSLNTFI